jgi:K(+)-stimulated pyrophosphate-energized sodium pump
VYWNTTHNLEIAGKLDVFSPSDPAVIIGLFIGGLFPYFFAAMTMEALEPLTRAAARAPRRTRRP